MRLLSILMVLLLAFAVFACSRSPVASVASDVAGGVQDVGSQDASNTNVGRTVQIELSARDFAFTPGTITVHKGDKVVLRIVDADSTHGIAIPSFGVDEMFGPNDLKTIEFVADKTGTFDFYCNVPCGSGHREMRGKLIVL